MILPLFQIIYHFVITLPYIATICLWFIYFCFVASIKV